MSFIRSAFYEIKSTLALATPIAAGHVGQMVLGFTDTVMIGRVGVVPLAASALANALIHFFFIIGVGILTSVSVLVAHAFGAKDFKETAAVCHRGVYLGGIVGILICLLCLGFLPFLKYMGQVEEVVNVSRFYFKSLAFSMPFALVFISLKAYTESIDLPWTVFWAGTIGIGLNIFLNWILIYGNLGMPMLGLDGAGIGTLLARVFTVFAAFWLVMRDKRFQKTLPKNWFVLPDLSHYKEMIKIGIPVGLQLMLEVGTFAMSTILAGTFGVVAMASHQIALTCAGLTFMVPLGIGIAVTVRIGHVLGSGERSRARVIGFSAMIFASLVSFFFGLLFILFNDEVVSVYTSDPATLKLAASLLIIAGLFQIVDATQIVAISSLRGTKDVNKPTWITASSFLGVALGGGCFLAYGLGLGVHGIWYGLALGLTFASVTLIARFTWVTRRGTGKILQKEQKENPLLPC